MSGKPVIVGVGEVLWDEFPDGRRLGGAPANFAFHAAQLGANATLVSRIGTDPEGGAIERELSARHVNCRLQRDLSHPTGIVTVRLEKGQPTYTITENSAWDFLEWSDDLAALASGCDAASFGTLAQRASLSRATIQRFIGEMPASALKLFDVNLRQSYYDPAALRFGLENATALKLNREELKVLAAIFAWPDDAMESSVHALFAAFPLEVVAVTLGSEGCGLFSRTGSAHAKPPAIIMADAVGAGDAFAAALVTGLLRERPLPEIADHAVRIGAFVASRPGAMPDLPRELFR